jgi:sterol desaturase/sphingolipid hydroxylase (fatty acid hydroxylase superfamily)
MLSTTFAFASVPLFLLAMLIEALLYRPRLGRAYPWGDTVASLAVALGSRLIHALASAAVISGLFSLVYAHRLGTLPLDRAWAWAAAFLAVEFAYYAWHAVAHRVRVFWAAHSVHHSSNTLTFATAQRIAWVGPLLSGLGLFLLPVVWLGVAPAAVGLLVALNLSYQLLLHTEVVRSFGPLEWILNTPSHHRVHHATNPEYLDRNFGGVLIIFDRLFGTFAAERASCRYGLLPPLQTRNPVTIALHGYGELFRDLRHARSWRERLHHLFDVPGWSADGSRATSDSLRADS